MQSIRVAASRRMCRESLSLITNLSLFLGIFAVFSAPIRAQEQLLKFTEDKFELILEVVESSRPGEASQLRLKVKSLEPADFGTQVLEDPLRLVLDVQNLFVRRPYFFPIEAHPLVVRVRVAQREQAVRVVLDLTGTQAPAYTAKQEGGYVIVTVEVDPFLKSTAPGMLPTLTAAEEEMPPADSLDAPEEEVLPSTLPVEVEPAISPSRPPEAKPVESPLPSAVESPVPIEPAFTPDTLLTSPPTIETPLPEVSLPPLEDIKPAPSPAAEPTPPLAALPLVEETEAPPADMAEPSPSPSVGAPKVVALRRLRFVPDRDLLPPAGGTQTPVKPSELGDIILPSSLSSPEALLKFSVDRVFVVFSDGARPIENIFLRNKSATTLYITSTAYRIERAGFPDQKIEETADLLVSPRRIVLEGHQERTVRLVFKGQPVSQEAPFRVTFIPQVDPFDKTLVDAQVSGHPARLNIVTGLAVLAAVLPPKVKSDLLWSFPNSRQVAIVNRGNVSVLLDSGRFCSRDGTRCAALPPKRLYPGNSWTLEVPGPGTAEFLKRTGTDYEAFIVPVGMAR